MNYLSFSGVSIPGVFLDPIFESSIKIKSKALLLREFLADLILTMNANKEELGFLGISLTGSRLTNLIAGRSVYACSNDLDFRLIFEAEESSFDLLTTKIRDLISSVIQNTAPVKLNFKSWMSSRDHSLTVVAFPNAVKGGSPIELTAHIISTSFWRFHRTVMDSFYIHLDAVDKEEYLLSSFEGDASRALEDARIGKITLLSEASIHGGGLVHYLLLITEGSFEEGDRIHQTFFAQDALLKRNTLLDSLILHINKKRQIPNYLFFFLLNVLFHSPSYTVFRMAIIEKLKKVLEESSETHPAIVFFKAMIDLYDLSSSNAVFTLNLPLLSDRVVLKNHLGKDQLQCEFVIEGRSLYVIVPFLEEDFSQMHLVSLPNVLKDKELPHYTFDLFKNAKLSPEVKLQVFLFLKDRKYILALATLVLQGTLPVIELERVVCRGILPQFLELSLHVENKNKLSVGVIRQVLESVEGSLSHGFWSALLEVPELAFLKKLPEKPWKRLFVQLVLKNLGLDEGERSFLYALKNYVSQDPQVEFPDLISSKETLYFLRVFSLFKDVIFLERFLALWTPAKDDVQILEELLGVLSTLERVTPVILQKANEKHTTRLLECFVFLLGDLKALSFFSRYLEDRIVLNVSKKLIKQAVTNKVVAWEVYQDFSLHPEIALFLEQTFFVGERVDGLQGSPTKLLKRIEQHALEGKGVLSCSLCLFVESYPLPKDKIDSLIASAFENAQNKDKVFSYITEHFFQYIPSILDSLLALVKNPVIGQEFLHKIHLNQVAISTDVQERGWLDFLGKVDKPFVFSDDLIEVFLVQYLDSIEDREKLSFLVKYALGIKLSLILREKLFRLILVSMKNPLETISNYLWSDQEMHRWFVLAERLELMTVECACVFASKLNNYIDNIELILKLVSLKSESVASLFKEGMKDKIQQNGIITLLVDKELFSVFLEDKDLAFAFLQLAVKYYQGKDRKLNKQIRTAAQFVLNKFSSIEEAKSIHLILEMVDHISPLIFTSVLDVIFSDIAHVKNLELLWAISLVFPKASSIFFDSLEKIFSDASMVDSHPIFEESIFWKHVSHHLSIFAKTYQLFPPLGKDLLENLYTGLLIEKENCLRLEFDKELRKRLRIISTASSSLFTISMAQGEIEIAEELAAYLHLKFINHLPLKWFDKLGMVPDLLVYFSYLADKLKFQNDFEELSIDHLTEILREAQQDGVSYEVIQTMIRCIVENSANKICIRGQEGFYTSDLALFSLNSIHYNSVQDFVVFSRLACFLLLSPWKPIFPIKDLIAILDVNTEKLSKIKDHSCFKSINLQNIECQLVDKCLTFLQLRGQAVTHLEMSEICCVMKYVISKMKINKYLNELEVFDFISLLIGNNSGFLIKGLEILTNYGVLTRALVTRIQVEMTERDWVFAEEKQIALNAIAAVVVA